MLNIGAPDDGTNNKTGFDKLKAALGKVSSSHVRKAIETYNWGK